MWLTTQNGIEKTFASAALEMTCKRQTQAALSSQSLLTNRAHAWQKN
jgi:hypothetical protein